MKRGKVYGRSDVSLRDVVSRAAALKDAYELIKLHKAFKSDMGQWEKGEDHQHSVMDYGDAKYIITEEPGNLQVLVQSRMETDFDVGDEKEMSEDRIIGYSYSYVEPYAGDNHQRDTSRRGTPKVSSTSDIQSLYIAELFVLPSERGRGLGELLLYETLCRRTKKVSRSHLFVSSKNANAVKIYANFGYRKAGHSGDASHDLLMQLEGICDALASRTSNIRRKFQQVNAGCLLCQRRVYLPYDRCTPPTDSTDTLALQPSHVACPPSFPAMCRACIENPPKENTGGGEDEEAVRTRAAAAAAEARTTR
eukprot:CAMPEP_0181297782 /NCGR_PEP_ID=MMETSP1101-20121128/5429_1 /TAXON_ID=46948 /ORGANISM="Rhodomonas abbreviata, Strain Caron Lab Isolate" /LENGTH=307 /DNA_ID=CAMNT_0023402753 /DNA_START=418 /DNA_END=1338 /DNA_ORIENTATION=+